MQYICMGTKVNTVYTSSNNSSSVFDFSLFGLFALNKDHRYKCSIDGMEYLQLSLHIHNTVKINEEKVSTVYSQA